MGRGSPLNTSLYASNTWSYPLKSEIGLNFQCQDLLMNNSTELIVPSCRMTHCLVDSPLREKGERERERERPIHVVHSLKRDERWVYSAKGNRSSFHSFHLIDSPRLIPFSTIEFSIWRKLFSLFNSNTLGYIQTSWFNRITCRRYLTTCQTILVNFHLTRCVPP